MNTLYFVDCDGVVTDSQANPDNNLITRFAFLGTQEPVCLLTGRPSSWLRDNIQPVFEQHFTVSGSAPRFPFMCAEYGTVRLHRQLNGSWHEDADDYGMTNFVLLMQAIALKKSDELWYDDDKVNTLSVVAKHDVALDQAEEALQYAEQAVGDIAKASRGKLVCKRSTYAVDLLTAETSKAIGVRFALDKLPKLPEAVRVFGDSLGDLAMADYTHDTGLATVMYFTGNPDILEGIEKPYIIKTAGGTLYKDATWKFLKELNL